MLIFEAEVFEFGFDSEQSQPVSQRGVDIKGFSGYFVLFAGQHGTEGPHVVQAVCHFDEDYPDVFRHGEQQFPEIFGLCGGFVAEDTSRYFGQSIDDEGDFFTEMVFDVLDSIFCVLYYVVQQRGADRSGS